MDTSVATPHYNPLSPKKTLPFRSSRINSHNNSLAKVETSFNKSIDLGQSAQRSFYSPQKQRKDITPIRETNKSIRIESKSPIGQRKAFKVEVTKTPKTWADTRAAHALTKAETESKDIDSRLNNGLKGFAPYVNPLKEDRRAKLVSGASSYRKSEVMKSMASTKPEINYKSDVGKSVKTSENAASKAKAGAKEKEPECFSYALGKGNNDAVVRRVMNKRFWWKETYSNNTVYDFCWYQTNKPINFTQLNSTKSFKKVANHFEFNREIGTKNNLLKNLQTYCDRNNLELFKITPLTFILDLHDPSYTSEFQVFTRVFKEFAKNKEEQQVEDTKAQVETPKTITKTKSKQPVTPRMTGTSQKYIPVKFPESFYNGCNLWLLKPTDFNRGRGINLFNKISTLEHYLKCFQKGEDQPAPNSSSSLKNPSSLNLVNSHRFVVQKYIEKPLLIDERKFDARVWVLVDHEMNLYKFKESYLRLSSETFNLDETQIEDKYVHLTNNAVQKYGKNYGKHENGNIISFNELEKWLPQNNPNATFPGIKDKIKDIIKITMESVKNKLNVTERKHCFEIFGYDFIFDAEGSVWVIEVNSNPCIEESNELLKMLVPRMLDDAFRLTIDKMFVPNMKQFKPEDMAKEGVDKEFPVTGYTNEENLWELITNLKGPQPFRR